MTSISSSRERAGSVSSMRSRNCPPVLRAKIQLNRADRAPPTCRYPVGAGEKRTRTRSESGTVRRYRPSTTERDLLRAPEPGQGLLVVPACGVLRQSPSPLVGLQLDDVEEGARTGGPQRVVTVAARL